MKRLLEETRWRWLGLGALLVVLTLLAYRPAIAGGFIWDDNGHVTRPELRSWHGLARIWTDPTSTQQYYPVLHSVFWLEHRLWGDAAPCYHVSNILLHAGVAYLVALVLHRLAIPGAWLAAAIFALHPVHVESVAWITEQKNTVSALFYLGAMLAYLRFDRTRQFAFYLLALGLFVLGLLGKTVIATLPAALLVIFWWQRGRLSWRRDVAPLIPWFVLGAIAGIFTAWVERKLIGAEGADFDLSFVARGLLAGRVLWFYLGKLLWPADLVFVYPRWDVSTAALWQYLFPLGIAVLATTLFLIRRRHPAPLAGFLFFAGSLFPVLGFLNVYPFVFSFVADHFLYLASLGIIVPVSAGLVLLLAKIPAPMRWLSVALPVMIVGVLGGLTWRQSRVYRDAETLHRTTVQRNPASWLAANNLGVELQASGRYGEAIPWFEQALKFKPDHHGARNNLGVSLAAVGRFEEAIFQYEQALRLHPDYSDAHHNLAVALANAGRAREALAHYGQALLCASYYPRVHHDWSFILMQAGLYPAAVHHAQEALRLNPYSVPALSNLGKSLQMIGRTDDAIAAYEQALRIDPAQADVLNNLGMALHASGRSQEAAVRFQAALRFAPDSPGLHYNLALSLREIGRTREAKDHYDQARRIDPRVPEIAWKN